MNYLAHFVINRDWLAPTRGDYFTWGVCLPDLWPLYSRRTRINWRRVRSHHPSTGDAAGLRHGLLNHQEVDRLFHTSQHFAAWQEAVKPARPTAEVRPLVWSFLAHIAVELALDRQLILAGGRVVEEFYAALEACDPRDVERLVARVGAVEPRGLADTLRRFLRRRFLVRYQTLGGLAEAVTRIFGLVPVAPPQGRSIRDVLERASAVVEPDAVFRELAGRYRPVAERVDP